MNKAMVLATVLLCFGCSAKPVPPTVGLYVFEENNYPCVRVEFPDQIKLEDITLEEKNDTVAVVYDIAMPGYAVQLVKLYGMGTRWVQDPLSSLSSGAAELYEISDEENAPDKSAAVTLEEIDGEIYVKASAAEFIQSDRAYRVDVYRRIKKIGVFKERNLEKWKNSSAGRITLNNMRRIIDYIYLNMGVSQCSDKNAIDMNWWKK